MGIYDGLRDAAKVLREADKIEQYKEIVTAMEKLKEQQARIATLEEMIASLKKVADLRTVSRGRSSDV